LCSDFDYSKEARVDSVRGAYFLINNRNWQKLTNGDLPLLDERYFIWFEEVDFCQQVYKLGGEVWYFPNASCLDYVGASFSQVKISAKQSYFEESMLKYFKKWHAAWQSVVLKIVWPLGRLLAQLFSK
jgi:GT2 family glycosyltransferase